MKEIALTNGMVALVDDEDFGQLSKRRWGACRDRKTGKMYATSGGVMMHREVMGLAKGDPRQVDHREPAETLNNQRSNLRICTQEQNLANRGKNRNNSTGIKGVHRNNKRGCLQVSIGVNGRQIHIGRFPIDRPELAAAAYREAATKYHGEFARFE